MKLFLVTMLMLTLIGSTSTAAAPDKGDNAPAFTLKGSDGKEYSLSDFAGKKVVVIAWYPKAFTGG